MANGCTAVSLKVDGLIDATCAHVELRQYHFARPPNDVLRSEARFLVELLLTPQHRSARACFPGLWSRHRFERIGTMYVVPPRMEMLVRSDETKPLTSILCEVKAELFLALFDEKPQVSDVNLLAALDVKASTVTRLLLRLAEEVRHPGFASEMLVESIVLQIAVELFRHRATIRQDINIEKGGLAPWQLRIIEERLKDAPSAPTLSELSELCLLSVRQLSRRFRASRGCSIGAYATNSRLEHAKHLLAKGDSVISIAKTLGFSSPSSFCFSFRRAMGIPPRQFRQKILAR